MIERILTVILALTVSLSYAQFFPDDKEAKKFEGLFDFYYKPDEDRVYLQVGDLEQEFLYVHALAEGLGSNDIGLDRGQLGRGVVVKFMRSGNKLLLVQPNLYYRANTSNEQERRSVREAFAKSVLFGAEIKERKGEVYLIDITDFLMRDAHGVASRLQREGQGSYKLDKKRSSVNLGRTRAFPDNVEFDLMLTFEGQPKGREIRSVAPDPQALTVYQHHSFVKLPDDHYKPRAFDPRCGGYPMSYMDYASPVNEEMTKRFIYRHRLEKKDPAAERSEAVEPIVYYLDPGTPEPVRSALLEGASWWNQAFEAAGYINAFQVKMLPQDADPLDLRYNVIQWVHRSTRGWSYGGSIADPRTGEIIKGHVSLGSLRIRQDFMIAQALKAPYADESPEDQQAMEMALARIRQLSAHEVGHTLGFAHNFAASTRDRSSVMDYPHPWIKANKGTLDFSQAYAVGIGEWDKVAVSYAYQDFPEGKEEGLNSILDQAFAQGHRYISDADARPAGSAHAHAHLWDNGNDIVAELDNVMEVRRIAMERFSEANIRQGQANSRLEDVFVPLYFYHRYQTEAVSKLLGGLDYNYAIRGDEQLAVSPVPAKRQKEALEALLRTISPEALAIPSALLELFPPRAIGLSRSRESFKSNLGVAFDPFGAASTASAFTFSFVLHPERASRLVAQGAFDKDQLGLAETIEALIEKTFEKNRGNSYENAVQNAIAQELLAAMMELAADPAASMEARAICTAKLSELAGMLENRSGKDEQRALDSYMATSILNFLNNPEKKTKSRAPKIPDGSPIGSY